MSEEVELLERIRRGLMEEAANVALVDSSKAGNIRAGILMALADVVLVIKRITEEQEE